MGTNYDRIVLPNDLQKILMKQYFLSATEIAICTSIAQGKNLEEILYYHSITRNTYKTHLKHIFSKTIEKGQNTMMKGHGKLQRLTWFLMNIEKEDIIEKKMAEITLRGDTNLLVLNNM